MRPKRIVIALALSVLGGGLAHAQEAAPVEVVFTTKRAEDKLEVGASSIEPAGPLKRMTVHLLNEGAKPLKLEYRIEWFDPSGAPVPGLSAWKTLFLDRKQEGAISATSQRVGAERARLTMRHLEQ